LDLVIGDRYVALTHVKDPARPDHHGFDLSVSVNDEFGNAELLVVGVVDEEPDHPGGPSLTGCLLGYPVRRDNDGCLDAADPKLGWAVCESATAAISDVAATVKMTPKRIRVCML
jgi:hypothetical protein